jgi:hypothetical protein
MDHAENIKFLLKYWSVHCQEMKMGTGGGRKALLILAGKPRRKRTFGTASGRIRGNIKRVFKEIINVTQSRASVAAILKKDQSSGPSIGRSICCHVGWSTSRSYRSFF